MCLHHPSKEKTSTARRKPLNWLATCRDTERPAPQCDPPRAVCRYPTNAVPRQSRTKVRGAWGECHASLRSSQKGRDGLAAQPHLPKVTQEKLLSEGGPRAGGAELADPPRESGTRRPKDNAEPTHACHARSLHPSCPLRLSRSDDANTRP